MTAASLNAVSMIVRKRDGAELAEAEIRALCRGFSDGSIPDYQMGAWLMAVYFRGMSEAETLALTLAMVESGKTLDWSHLPRPPVDKHSTGGVGDKTTLVLVPLLAATGVPFVKMSGRGLGHTGGTLDKLESIPGMSVNLSLEALRSQVERIGCALIGQTSDLVPADGQLYAMRDVTGTVESLSLIASSIMSKKLAGGAPAMVLDVKYGSGAFMQSQDAARELAGAMVRIGKGAGRQVSAVMSSMEEPLGCAVGNALEVREAIETLRGGGPADLWELTLQLGAQLLLLAGVEKEPAAARALLEEHRRSGAALLRFAELVKSQGGDERIVGDPGLLPTAPIIRRFAARESGWVRRVDARTIAEAALALGAGRRKKSDPVDPAVGIVLSKRVGDRVAAGESIAEIHARSEAAVHLAEAELASAFDFSSTEVAPEDRAYEVIT